MVLLRKVIGDALRARRLAQRRTLREVSTAANVSLGYLSEIERGHKEASSELLASICDALGAPLSEMLNDVSTTFALAEQMEEAFSSAVSGHEAAQQEAALLSLDDRDLALDDASLHGAALDDASLHRAALDDAVAALEQAVTEGDVTVQVHTDGPLRTTLITTRIPPGQRFTDKIFVG